MSDEYVRRYSVREIKSLGSRPHFKVELIGNRGLVRQAGAMFRTHEAADRHGRGQLGAPIR
jgi:hypothetical protein